MKKIASDRSDQYRKSIQDITTEILWVQIWAGILDKKKMQLINFDLQLKFHSPVKLK